MLQKSIKLSGPALELAKLVKQEWDAMHTETAEIERQAIDAIQQRKLKGQAATKKLMVELLESLGIPSTHHNLFGLDSRYLEDHGDAFAITIEPPRTPSPDPVVTPQNESDAAVPPSKNKLT